MDAESLKTVAGVARLLRRAAELAWTQADAAGPRSPRQLLALGIGSAADEASSKSTTDPLDKSMSARAGTKAES